MCNNKKRILECPCDKCITLAICKNKTIEQLVHECILINKFLIESVTQTRTSKTTILYTDPLHAICHVMGIGIRKDGNNILIKYRWSECYGSPV